MGPMIKLGMHALASDLMLVSSHLGMIVRC